MANGRISGYCWDRNPRKAGRCVLNAGHRGNHYDWYARRSWNQPGAEWPNRGDAR